MQILRDAHSYKVYGRAAVQAQNAIEDLNDSTLSLHWFVIAQPDGRFTPAVKVDSSTAYLLHYFINRKIAVIN